MLTRLAGAALLISAAAVPSYADAPDTFNVRVTIDLCPEYAVVPAGTIVYDIVYSIGSDPALYSPEIISESVDKDSNSLTAELKLPADRADTPLNIKASCRNAFGFSDPSNSVAVSNCDRIAAFDSDGDGITDEVEDTNCNNRFDISDASNFLSVDSDNDGVRDLVELVLGTSRTNPGDSPRPFIYKGGSFDPDGDGNSNPVVWRSWIGQLAYWYIRDYREPGSHIIRQWGLQGDIPFVYDPDGAPSDIGVIRKTEGFYWWFFDGPGFQRSDGGSETLIPWGVEGDVIVLGPWEKPGVTNPAIGRLIGDQWSWWILQSDGTFRVQFWGLIGDILKPQDLDGDGLFDISIYRPSENTTYALLSTGGSPLVRTFGSPTGELLVRGDYTGDGIEEITFWQPQNPSMFKTMLSDSGFDEEKTAMKNPDHFFELQLGLFGIHLPLNYYRQGGLTRYTVIDHAAGLRYIRVDNNPSGEIVPLQWGLFGDHQG